MKLHQLTNRVWYMENDTATDRPTLGYVLGDRRAVMLDAGNSGEHAALFLEAVRREGLPKPELVCISHAHWDHTFGIASLGLPAIASETTNAFLLQMACWGWSEGEMAKRLETGEESAFCDTHIRLEYPDRSRIQVRGADIIFRDSLTLELGNCPLELWEGVSPHADDCTLMLADGVLFLGDAYCSVPVGNDWIYDKELLAAFIRLLKEADFRLCLKGHHAPQTKEELLAELTQELEKIK